MNISSPATNQVTSLAVAPAILAAANLLLPHLERGQRVDAAVLRSAMETAFGRSDATGAWDWKLAYEACEVATVLFLRKYGNALFRKAASPASRLDLLVKIAGLLPTQTRRSEESQSFQQFSTPLPLGLAALTAATITPDDVVLEPSAGTGLIAILAQIAGGSLILNELADTCAALLSSLFPALSVTQFDAAQIDDHLAADVDTDASNKALDADMALQELGADVAGLAYVTATITVWDNDPRRADEKLRLVEKVIQSRDFNVMVETVNAVDAWLGSLPGHAYGNLSLTATDSQLIADARTRWETTVGGLQDALRVQAGVVGNIDSNRMGKGGHGGSISTKCAGAVK